MKESPLKNTLDANPTCCSLYSSLLSTNKFVNCSSDSSPAQKQQSWIIAKLSVFIIRYQTGSYKAAMILIELTRPSKSPVSGISRLARV